MSQGFLQRQKTKYFKEKSTLNTITKCLPKTAFLIDAFGLVSLTNPYLEKGNVKTVCLHLLLISDTIMLNMFN